MPRRELLTESQRLPFTEPAMEERRMVEEDLPDYGVYHLISSGGAMVSLGAIVHSQTQGFQGASDPRSDGSAIGC